MSDDPLTLADIVSWLRSTERAAVGCGISLAGVRQRSEYLPMAFADFDGDHAMGRVAAWANGCFDFEVLRVADGKHIFFRHEEVLNVADPSLDDAYREFLRHMSCSEGSQNLTPLADS
jgi:hypothetical protein